MATATQLLLFEPEAIIFTLYEPLQLPSSSTESIADIIIITGQSFRLWRFAPTFRTERITPNNTTLSEKDHFFPAAVKFNLPWSRLIRGGLHFLKAFNFYSLRSFLFTSFTSRELKWEEMCLLGITFGRLQDRKK